LATYRLILLGENGLPVGRERQIECPNDAAATDAAFSLKHPYGVEIWDLRRLIVRAEPPHADLG
jgi:hypothetical protein